MVSLFVSVNDFVRYGLILFRFVSNLGENNLFVLCLVLQVFLVKRSFCLRCEGKEKKDESVWLSAEEGLDKL